MESTDQQLTNTQKVIKSLRKKLDKSGWNSALWGFWSSSEFERIIDRLYYNSTVLDKRWIPGADLMFRFLYSCPYNKVKVVMLVDMTSVTWAINDGIPMSAMKGNAVNSMVEEMMKTIPGQNDNAEPPKDLAVWAKQGVLMIPIALTAEVGKKGHYELWQPLIAYLIDHINHHKPQVPWVVIGKRAKECRGLIHTEDVQERLFTIPFWSNGLWEWLDNKVIMNNMIPIEWVK